MVKLAARPSMFSVSCLGSAPLGKRSARPEKTAAYWPNQIPVSNGGSCCSI